MDEGPKDDLKWFGEGFDGFPKRLPDDTVEYVIHAVEVKATDAQTRSRLAEIRKSSIELDRKLLKDYIWQRDTFVLELQRENNRWVLRGRTNYGDSVADEWVIVWILRELSTRFSDAWIRVFDTDGEFLLIEAAEMLPRWLNPEIAEGRIWINNGKLLMIPPNQQAAADAKDPKNRNPLDREAQALSTEDTLRLISATPSKLLHSPLVEEEAFYRIRDYPKTILSENMHHALLTVPRKLAYVLHRNPRYVGPAIEAFYLRDPISLKPLKSKPLDDMFFPPTDLVTVSVRFSKVMFAQIRSQEFVPPPTWAKTIAEARADETTFQKADAGMKLACGFEMLLSDRGNRDKQAVRELNVLLDDIVSGEEELPSDADIGTWNRQEDDEKWLDINFEDFEQELAGRAGKAEPGADRSARPGAPSREVEDVSRDKGGFGDKAAQENLRKMVSRFESFLNSQDAEDAEYLDDMDHDDDLSPEESDDDSEEDKVAGIDDEEFERAMREMMGLPPEQRAAAAPDVLRRAVREIEEYNESDEEAADEADEIKKMAEEMEKELRGIGALNIDGGAAGFGDPRSNERSTKGKQKADT